jgi:hypothetical protein
MTDKIQIPDAAKQALLSKYVSRLNKIHLVIGWTHFRNWYIDWKWAGNPYRSRMLFRFSPDGNWVQAESFEEDLMPTYKFGKDSK